MRVVSRHTQLRVTRPPAQVLLCTLTLFFAAFYGNLLRPVGALNLLLMCTAFASFFRVLYRNYEVVDVATMHLYGVSERLALRFLFIRRLGLGLGLGLGLIGLGLGALTLTLTLTITRFLFIRRALSIKWGYYTIVWMLAASHTISIQSEGLLLTALDLLKAVFAVVAWALYL